jgi:LmbE family N-acetylglucosaminyl deacetylase
MGTFESELVLRSAASVLAVCAHPDDESFGLRAVLHHLATTGTTVSVLCFTHGEASTLGTTAGALHEVRRDELMAAAAELGIDHVELLDYPDGGLESVPLEMLAADVTRMVNAAKADLLLVFDEGGVTGHPDHHRATLAALHGASELPVLAWTLPRRVAEVLNAEFATAFAGRDQDQIDLMLGVNRDAQRRAISRHLSQSVHNPVLWRRLELLEGREALRWLRRGSSNPGASSKDTTTVDERRLRFEQRSAFPGGVPGLCSGGRRGRRSPSPSPTG